MGAPRGPSLTIQVLQQRRDGGCPALPQQRVDALMQGVQEAQRGGPAAVPHVGPGGHRLMEVQAGAPGAPGTTAPHVSPAKPPHGREARRALGHSSPKPHGARLTGPTARQHEARDTGTEGEPTPSPSPPGELRWLGEGTGPAQRAAHQKSRGDGVGRREGHWKGGGRHTQPAACPRSPRP